MASYASWANGLPFKVNRSGVRIDLTFYIYPDGHGNIVYGAERNNHPVANVEQAVGVFRDVWERAAAAHNQTTASGQD